MSNQNQVRNVVRSYLPNAIANSLPNVLKIVQTQRCAVKISTCLWCCFDKNLILKLLSLDDIVLCDYSFPDYAIRTELIKALEEYFTRPSIETALPSSKYSRGSKLLRIIRNELNKSNWWIYVKRSIDDYFELLQTDRVASKLDIVELAWKLFINKMIDDYEYLTETDRAYRIKVISTYFSRINSDKKIELIRSLTIGNTRAFPLVIKYLNYNQLPIVHDELPMFSQPTVQGFCSELLAFMPEANYVKKTLQMYTSSNGALFSFLSIDNPISERLHKDFENLPYDIPMKNQFGLIDRFVSKKDVIREYRRTRYRLLDGIVCALSIAVLIEWLLRQTLQVFSNANVSKLTGYELVKKVSKNVELLESKQSLETLFNNRVLSIRNSLAHSSFLADDIDDIDKKVNSLSWCLYYFINDLRHSRLLNKVFVGKRWDSSFVFSDKVLKTVNDQFFFELNLSYALEEDFIENGGDVIRPIYYRRLGELLPDKRILGQSAFLLWINAHNEYKNSKLKLYRQFEEACIRYYQTRTMFRFLSTQFDVVREKVRQNDMIMNQYHQFFSQKLDRFDSHYKQFICLFISVLSVEELFRAIAEEKGLNVVKVLRENSSRIKCELSMLGNQSDMLLHESFRSKMFIFDFNPHSQEFVDSLYALEQIRNKLLHGQWFAFTEPFIKFTHLINKIMFNISL